MTDSVEAEESSRCLFCESEENLERHHIVPRKYGGKDIDENLVRVCGSCHKKIERVWNARFFEQLGCRAGYSPNQLYDCVKEMRTTVNQTRIAIESAFVWYDELAEYNDGEKLSKYGNGVTRETACKIKRDAYFELLEGEVYEGLIPIGELEDLERYSYRLVGEDPPQQEDLNGQ